MDIKVGGWGEPKDATKETQGICDQVKSLVEGKTHKIFQEFKAVEYRDQIVAGKNFLIKIHVGGHNYIHLFVFRDLPCNGGRLELLGVQQHKTKDDPLEPFNN
ncbi:leukocyte cysteine proteinase inhibitor 1-like [Pagrus major]|uniref:leukocyte cysteine proteinase inhibitor 1-like n=1 Tax=Pagrus major TaxID=143350 RepID=UPI003CC86C94